MPNNYFIIDTNVLVSGAIFPASIPSRCLNKILAIGNVAYSQAILIEYREILLSGKFDKYISIENREEFLTLLVSRAQIIEVNVTIKACRDPKDDKYLELAVACNASCIVTGDKDLLVMHPFGSVSILTPGDFLNWF